MTRLFSLLLALTLIAGWLPATNAQKVESAVSVGPGIAALYSDIEGNAVANLTVTGVDHAYLDEDDKQGPDHGYRYEAVTFTVENVTEDALIVETPRFSVVDGLGKSHGYWSVQIAGDPGDRASNRFALIPGEVAEVVMVFNVPAHTSATMLTWEPETGVTVLVHIGADASTVSAIAFGLNTPAARTDDFGNVIATVEVNSIDHNWTDYADRDAPDEGQTYRAVSLNVTNETDRPVAVDAYNFGLVHRSGLTERRGFAESAEGADQDVLRDTVNLGPGESVDVMLVFLADEGEEAVALLWQDYSHSMTIIAFDGPVDAADSTPEAVASPTGN